MLEFHTVAKTGDIPPGEGRSFPVAGQLIAVFNVDGEFMAINDICPHMGASLAEGYLEGASVTCPWHAWRFCVREGTWLDNPTSPLKSDCYPVRVEGDDIQVGIEPAEEKPTTSSE